jgi:signal transduction histidine kinase
MQERTHADSGWHGDGQPPGPPVPPPWRGGPPWQRRRRGRLWGHWSSEPLRRVREERFAGGVAAGIAAKTGFNVTLVRIVFVLAALGSGFGAAVYVVAWLLIPAVGEPHNIASEAITDRRGIALAAALASVLVVLQLAASAVGASWLADLSWPLIVSVAGIVLIWRNAPEVEQALIRRVAEPLLGLSGEIKRSRIAIRVVLALILLSVGAGVLLSGHPNRSALRPLSGVVLVIAAIVVMLGPWWLRVARDLVNERQARARAEERADMAARVHDSVLQTLALIQLKAEQPQQVVQLARAQERELRSWLFDGTAPGSLDGKVTTIAAGVRRIQQDVETQHGVSVEAVTVGDCDLDEDLAALLAAAREATVNAVKWSGAPEVSVFAEVEPGQVSVFVRDRGRGFDPAAVPGDRKGLAESVHARMARHGGTATVRSIPGEGTEVSLRMPRAAGERVPGRA